VPVLFAYFRRESILAARYNKVVLPMYGVIIRWYTRCYGVRGDNKVVCWCMWVINSASCY
jgi:hypothetical protein